MWHASTATRLPLSTVQLRAAAFRELEGVGDPELGQWEEHTGKAFHLRRRLTAEEAVVTGPVCDLRHTSEGSRRLSTALRWMRPEHRAWALEEMA